MAISLDELAVVAFEGTVGPLTLAVGAGALAVALAAGSTRPLRRMASTSVLAAGRTAQFNPAGWIEVAKRQWASLVDEARAEYEASRAPSPILTSAAEVARPIVVPTLVVASSTGAVAEAGSGVVTSATDATDPMDAAPETGSLIVAISTGAVPETGNAIAIPGVEDADAESAIVLNAGDDADADASLSSEDAARIRDQRGRFIRRAPNGVQSE